MNYMIRVRKFFGLGKPMGFRRWSPQELSEKKRYLEEKNPKEYTKDDHYLMLEWVFHRYLPPDFAISDEQWDSRLNELRRKIDKNLSDPTYSTDKHNCFSAKPNYCLNEEDFKRKVIPALMRFDLVPNPYSKTWNGFEVWEMLFALLHESYCEQREAKDSLLPHCDVFLVEKLVKEVSRTFVTLVRAKEDGSQFVKISTNHNQCEICQQFDGQMVPVYDLLDEFSNGHPRFPHPIEFNDQAEWCHAPYLIPSISLSQDDDAAFHQWLVKALS